MNFEVQSFREFPLEDKQRHRTDVCCTYVNTLFVIAMFVTACVMLNPSRLAKMTYPTDISGQTCGHQINNYPYLYYTSLQDPTKRLCVSQCPSQNDTKLQCYPTESLGCKANSDKQFTVQIYNSTLQSTRLGLFCLPVDTILRAQVLENAKLSHRFGFINTFDAVVISMVTAAVLGILYGLLVHCLPTRHPWYVVLLGGICYIIFSALIIVFSGWQHTLMIIVQIVLILLLVFLGLLMLFSICRYSIQIKTCGLFLKYAGQVINSNKIYLFAVPVFLILTFGLFVLCLFQLLSYWSYSQLQFSPQNTYYTPSQNSITILLTVFNFLELLWGLSFLKEAFNFVISGKAAQWYFHEHQHTHINPINNLFRYHWGSVLSGSSILGAFFILDLIFDAFMPQEEQFEQKNQASFYKKCCNYLFGGCFKPLLELVRSEAMTYIHLSGLSYCNSSRTCQFINYATDFFNDNQSVNRMYRLGAHSILVSLSTITAIIFLKIQGISPSPYTVLFIIVVCIFIVTFVISLHSDAGEALLITILIEQYLHQQTQQEYICPAHMLQEVMAMDKQLKWQRENLQH